MKKNIIVTFIITFVVSYSFMISGCKNFLEKPAGGTVTVDTIFDTQNQAQYAVAEMNGLCINSYFALGVWGCRPEVITDEVYILHPDEDWAMLGVYGGPYYNGNMMPSQTCDYSVVYPGPGTSFGQHYLGIRQANLVLQHIDQVADATDAWKSDVKGQALFCRAMQHFELFRYYGGVPIVTTPLNGSENINIHRSSVAAVVDSVVSWCNQAASLLPDTRSATDYGKATKLAALALKARILLYAASPLYNTPPNMASLVQGARYGDARDSVLCYPSYDVNRWNTAAQASLDVINNAAAAGVALYNTGKPSTTGTGEQYTDLGDYASVWNVYGNNELILVNTKTPASTNDWGSSVANAWSQYLTSHLYTSITGAGTWGIKNNVPVEFLQQYQKADGTDWTMPQSGDDLPTYLQGLKLDPRFYQTIAYDGMTYARGYVLDYYRAGGGFAAGKLVNSQGTDGFGYAVETYKYVGRVDNMSLTHFTWPVFRLAEFYLSYAEAMNEFQGPTADATHYLNLIRERAGMPDYNLSDQTAFRAAVQRERTIEFAYENFRYNDLLRWLQAASVLNSMLHGIQTTAANVGGALHRNWQIVDFSTRSFPQRYYYLPFPDAEVSKNYLGDGKSWAGQNPGWN